MKYPTGTHCFEKIREGEYVYVDKTALMYDLVKKGKSYFLCRPRQFGKSVLVSTLKYYFLGRKELFDQLAVSSLETEWNVYPVFHIDFGEMDFSEPNALDEAMDEYIGSAEKAYGIMSSDAPLGARFHEVLKTAHEQTGRRAVVLIDGYDRPLADVIGRDIAAPVVDGDIQSLTDYNRERLKAFYNFLKLDDEHLQFVFITGETTLAYDCVFCGFKQPADISYDPQYEAICGITKGELFTVFKRRVRELGRKNEMKEQVAKDKFCQMFASYHFSKNLTEVFNTYAVLKSLAKKKFKDYWFSKDTVSYLMGLLSDNDMFFNELTNKGHEPSEFASYRPCEQKPLPMFYQKGYLTIKGYGPFFSIYRLDFPNEALKTALLSILADDYFVPKGYYSAWAEDANRTLRSGDVFKFSIQLTSILWHVSDRFQRKGDDKKHERHFLYAMYLIMQLLSKYNTYVEKLAGQGRMDCVLECADYVYIFGFKMDDTASGVLKHLEDKGYGLPYAEKGRKVYRVGIIISSETGAIIGYEWA